MDTVLSIDIGGTTSKLAVVNAQYDILAKRVVQTANAETQTVFFDMLYAEVDALLGAYPSIKGIGVGAPSCQGGAIVGIVNLPFEHRVEIVKMLQMRYQLPVVLIKDGNAAALGEGAFGVTKGMQNYVVLTLGTGLGCGMVLNGKVLEGSGGQAGELCHSVLIENGRSCKCGKRGCFEMYVSATGLHRTIFQLMADEITASTLRSISYEQMSAKRIAEAAQAGDKLAIQAFNFTGNILGRKIAELAMIFEPEAFVLAGGVSAANDLLLRPTIEQMEADLLPAFKGKIKVFISSLNTNDAALLGAASLVL